MAYTKEEWWHKDKEGRRIGWLWPEDMEAILESAYGPRKWVNTFSQKFGFARSTVDRWRDGSTPIPKHVAMIVNMISSNNVRGIPTPDIEADWLPDVEGANAKLTADAVTDKAE
jgi:hypothetical protein